MKSLSELVELQIERMAGMMLDPSPTETTAAELGAAHHMVETLTCAGVDGPGTDRVLSAVAIWLGNTAAMGNVSEEQVAATHEGPVRLRLDPTSAVIASMAHVLAFAAALARQKSGER